MPVIEILYPYEGKYNFLHFMEIGNKLRVIKCLVQVKQLVSYKTNSVFFFFLVLIGERVDSHHLSRGPQGCNLALICPLLALYGVAGRAQKQIWLPWRDLQGAAANR